MKSRLILGLAAILVALFACWWMITEPFMVEKPEIVPLAASAGGGVVISVTTAGSAGSATANGAAPVIVQGQVMAIYVDYGAVAGTTDITVSSQTTPTENILTLVDNATSRWVYPRRTIQTITNTNVTYDGTYEVHEPFWVGDYITLTVGDSTPAQIIKAHIYWRR